MLVHSLLGLLAAGLAVSMPPERPIRIDRAGNPYPETLPSFDCKAARSYAERAICADRSLGWSDRGLAFTYVRLLQHSPASEHALIRAKQRDWIAARDRCADIDCVRRAYDRAGAMGAQLTRIDAARRASLRREGSCAKTQVDYIGGRFSPMVGEPLDGTSVGFANGVWQVSYVPEAPVFQSRLGDPVRVCLVEIPRHCPPGDNRGRIYHVMNLRTRGEWKLPDSAHSCGGA